MPRSKTRNKKPSMKVVNRKPTESQKKAQSAKFMVDVRFNILVFLNNNERFSKENMEIVFNWFSEKLKEDMNTAQIKLNILFSIFESNKLKYNLIDSSLNKEVDDQTAILLLTTNEEG